MRDLLWGLVMLLNLATLLLFGWDKLRSGGAGRRVPERTLLWCMFLGGFPAAWLAMGWFRHKTKKQPFRRYAMLWTVLSPLWLLVWWSWTARG